MVKRCSSSTDEAVASNRSLKVRSLSMDVFGGGLCIESKSKYISCQEM
jgi:hypothetical protein